MMCLALALAAGIVTCRIDQPSGLAPVSGALLDGSVQPNKLNLKYVCGNRYRVRNHNPVAAVVGWRVIGTTDSAHVTVPAKGAGPPNGYGEAMFTTNVAGETGLYFEGQLLETEPNKGNACPSGNVVPATAPNTLPQGLEAESNLALTSPGAQVQFVKDHVMVFFRPTATQAQRQQAADAVSGVVVGGFHLPAGGEGAYLIKLPTDVDHQLVREAVALLSTLPHVRLASLYYVNLAGEPTYRRPEDLGAWGPNAWRITPRAAFPLNANRQTWAVEAINAPLAWGCSVGDSTVRVAVIDHGFHTAGWAGDAGNVVEADLDNLSADNFDHGSRMASILGASGNNRSGMTGVLWRASLDLRDVTLRDSVSRAPILSAAGNRRSSNSPEFLTKMQRAALSGARIFSMSLGADQTPMIQRDSAGLADAAALIAQVRMATIELPGRQADPLLVVSSGNVPNGDPFGSLWPNLKDSLESRVLVVTAVNASGLLRSAPANNRLIDLVSKSASYRTDSL